jgi:hypothetical protein
MRRRSSMYRALKSSCRTRPPCCAEVRAKQARAIKKGSIIMEIMRPECAGEIIQMNYSNANLEMRRPASRSADSRTHAARFSKKVLVFGVKVETVLHFLRVRPAGQSQKVHPCLIRSRSHTTIHGGKRRRGLSSSAVWTWLLCLGSWQGTTAFRSLPARGLMMPI